MSAGDVSDSATPFGIRYWEKIGGNLRLANVLLVLLVLGMFAAPASGTAAGTHDVQWVNVEPQTGDKVGFGMASSNCKGIPVMAVVCVAAVTGSVKVCADVEANGPLGIKVSGTACSEYAGAASVAASGSLVEYELKSVAKLEAWMEPEEVKSLEDCETQYDPYMEEVTYCNEKVSHKQTVLVKKHYCQEAEQQVTSAVEAALVDPTNVQSWMPGWEAHSCESAVGIGGDYQCIEMLGEATGTADLWAANPDRAESGSCSSSADWVQRVCVDCTSSGGDEDEYTLTPASEVALKDALRIAYVGNLAGLLMPAADSGCQTCTDDANEDTMRALLVVASTNLLREAENQLQASMEQGVKYTFVPDQVQEQ